MKGLISMYSKYDANSIANVFSRRIRELRRGDVTHAQADGTLSTFDVLMLIATGIMVVIAVQMLISGTWTFDAWASNVPMVLLVVVLGTFLLSPQGAGKVLRNVPSDMFRPDEAPGEVHHQDMLGK